MAGHRSSTLADDGLPARLEQAVEGPLVALATAATLPAALASLANTLGGWVLLDEEPDPALLRDAVDPPAPFSSTRRGGRVLVHVPASDDAPHVTADGEVLVRDADGARPADVAELAALAARGERGIARARVRLETTLLVEQTMETPDRIAGDAPIVDESFAPEAPLELIVRATPVSVPAELAERLLSEAGSELVAEQAVSLLLNPDAVAHRIVADVDARSTGIYALASGPSAGAHADVVADAAGVVAARFAERRSRSGTVVCDDLADDVLLPLLRAVSGMLAEAGAYGRAVLDLEIRGAGDLAIEWTPELVDTLLTAEVGDADRLLLEGDLGIPATGDELDELAARWTRALARAAGLPAWEP